MVENLESLYKKEYTNVWVCYDRTDTTCTDNVAKALSFVMNPTAPWQTVQTMKWKQ